MLRLAKSVGVAVVVAYLAVMLGLYAMQRSFLYHPDRARVMPAAAGLDAFAEVETAAGQRSWWHAPPRSDAPVILYLHGNGGALAGRSTIFAAMAAAGNGVLGVGYPGYGGNAGDPAETAMHRAALANYDWLRRAGIAANRIVIVAHSMGTGVAVPLAVERPVAGLVLESPFTSMTDAAQRAVPWAPVRWLITDRFDSAARIGAVRAPIAWVHGTDDMLIPIEMGARLLARARVPVCSHIIAGGDHDHLWAAGGGNYTLRQVAAMVQTGRCAGRAVVPRQPAMAGDVTRLRN